jgi:hypothetical protein
METHETARGGLIIAAISYLFMSPSVARRRGKHPAALTVCLRCACIAVRSGILKSRSRGRRLSPCFLSGAAPYAAS